MKTPKKIKKDNAIINIYVLIFVAIIIGLFIYVPTWYDKWTKYDIIQTVELINPDTENYGDLQNDWYGKKREEALGEDWVNNDKWINLDSIYESSPFISGKPVFKLVTGIRDHLITDYGDEKTIQALKCQRLIEIKESIKKDKAITLEIEKAKRKTDSLNELALERLQQPCK